MNEATPRPMVAEAPGPADYRDAATTRELKKAVLWVAVAAGAIGLWFLAQPLLLIIGGCVVAAMLDGGTRLLGRVTRLSRGWRLAIVCLGVLAFLVFLVLFGGSQIAAQFNTLQTVVEGQVNRLMGLARSAGLIPRAPPPAAPVPGGVASAATATTAATTTTGTTGGAGGGLGGGAGEIAKQLMGSLGQVTAFVGSALGALSSLAMIVVLGLFIAAEPRLYERGIAWMLPLEKRVHFYETSSRMASTLRRLMAGRLLGMAVEGVFVAIALELVGVQMALLLGILTGLLAFLPNIGAIVSGVLIVLVGFAGGSETGFWAIGVYAAVQMFDGYVIVPMVARRSVDLPPALVLGAQLLFGALFGILGLALADPMVAMIKVLLEQRSEIAAEEAGAAPG